MDDSSLRYPTISHVVGVNLARLRKEAGLTADEIAARVRLVGLDWSRSTVTNLETNRKVLEVNEFILLLMLFGGPNELLAGEHPARLSPRFDNDLADLRNQLRGFRTDGEAPLNPVDGSSWRKNNTFPESDSAPAKDPMKSRTNERPNEAELKAARKYKVPPEFFQEVAWKRWGCSMTDERERRLRNVPFSESKSKNLRSLRGRITRNLLEEIDAALKKYQERK